MEFKIFYHDIFEKHLVPIGHPERPDRIINLNKLIKNLFPNQIQKIKSQDKSWKDEILMVWLIAMLSTGWFDETRDNFEEWVRIINDLPDSVWYLVIIVFTATFSTKMTDKVLNRNKKK